MKADVGIIFNAVGNWPVETVAPLRGIASDIWNEGKSSRPVPVEQINIKVLVDETVKKVFIASPDQNNGSAAVLECTFSEHSRGILLEFTVPMLEIWDLIHIETEPIV